jgi:uncharacterized protein DUF551
MSTKAELQRDIDDLEAFVEWVREAPCRLSGDGWAEQSWWEERRANRATLAQERQSPPTNDWIPVGEQLPAEGQEVLLRVLETGRKVLGTGPTRGEPLPDQVIYAVGSYRQSRGWHTYDDIMPALDAEPPETGSWARVSHWMPILEPVPGR